MCFRLGTTSDYIWDCGTPQESVVNGEDYDRITDIYYEIVKDGRKIQYSERVWSSIGHPYLQDPVSLPEFQCMWDSWWTNVTRTGSFPSTSVLPCHCNSIHIFILHTHLIIASLFNLSNRQCCLMGTVTERHRQWKRSRFGGSYF